MTDLIKAKIQELCPDVMFDCKQCGGNGYYSGHEGGCDGNCTSCPVQVQCSDCSGGGKFPLPITLAVILRAIEEVDKQVAITARGQFLLVLNGAFTYEPPHIIWNLENDNYDQQSEECKQFIGSLLN